MNPIMVLGDWIKGLISPHISHSKRAGSDQGWSRFEMEMRLEGKITYARRAKRKEPRGLKVRATKILIGWVSLDHFDGRMEKIKLLRKDA